MTSKGRPLLILSDRVEGRTVRRRNSMRRKPAHPDAEGIADDGGDENGEQQRPAAKVMIKIHRMSAISSLSNGTYGKGKTESVALYFSFLT